MIRTARVVDFQPKLRKRNDAAPGGIYVMNDDIPSAKAASSRRFWGVRERAYKVADPMGLSPKPGDTVEIFLPPGRTVLSAAITFLLPLALFPVGFSLADRLFPGMGADAVEAVKSAAESAASAASASNTAASEGFSFLIGFGFLLAGIPFGALLRRITGNGNAVPQITRVLTSAEAVRCSKDGAGCGSCTICG